MTTWAEYRLELRVGMLNDNPTDPAKRRWSDTQLAIYMRWAQNTLCAHTALPKTVTFSGAVNGKTWAAPDDVYRDKISLEEYGLLSFTGASGKEVFYNPRSRTKGAGPGTSGNYFFVAPDDQIYLTNGLSAAGTLRLWYFAYYPTPSADGDVLQIPSWAEGPLSYLVAANALGSYSMDAAQIKMWAEAPEKGSPESNPFRAQQKWFLDVYEREIARFPIQARVNYYRYLVSS